MFEEFIDSKLSKSAEKIADSKVLPLTEKIDDLTSGIEIITDVVSTIPQMVDEKISTLKSEISVIKGEKGDKGDDADEDVIIEKVLARIPIPEDGIDGLDGSPDTVDEVLKKVNSKKGGIKSTSLEGFESLVNQTTLKGVLETLDNQTRYLIQKAASQSASGLTSVAHDATLTGDGTPGNPLSVVTTTSGVNSINGDSTSAQTLTTGTTGTDFAIVDDGVGDHKFNLPVASATNTGKLSSADWTTFNTGVASVPNLKTNTFGVVCDGQGTVVTTGLKNYFRIPYNGTITGWTIISNITGSIVFDVWKAAGAIPTVANTITASAKPTLSSAQLNTSTTLTGWTTAVTEGDIFGFNVDSVSTVTWAILEINITKS